MNHSSTNDKWFPLEHCESSSITTSNSFFLHFNSIHNFSVRELTHLWLYSIIHSFYRGDICIGLPLKTKLVWKELLPCNNSLEWKKKCMHVERVNGIVAHLHLARVFGSLLTSVRVVAVQLLGWWYLAAQEAHRIAVRWLLLRSTHFGVHSTLKHCAGDFVAR